jgi:hypothetical protein
MSDYSVFDKFLRVDTWLSGHPNDEERFFKCLHEVVTLPDFNADAMGEYLKQKKGVTSDDHLYSSTIRDLVTKAWAVRDYLQYTDHISAYEDPDVQV